MSMRIKIKKTEKPNVDLLLNLFRKFEIDNINISYFENLFEFYEDKNLIGFINYIILPAMKGFNRVYIRDLMCIDNNYIDKIIKTLCSYCKKNKLTIRTSVDTKTFSKDYEQILYNNGFTGNHELYYIY